MSDNLNEIERRLSVHEAQCEERWKTIFVRLEDIVRLGVPVSYRTVLEEKDILI